MIFENEEHVLQKFAPYRLMIGEMNDDNMPKLRVGLAQQENTNIFGQRIHVAKCYSPPYHVLHVSTYYWPRLLHL